MPVKYKLSIPRLGWIVGLMDGGGNLERPVAQVSKPAVSPTSKSAAVGLVEAFAGLETRDTADLEVCATYYPNGGHDHTPVK
jgi:hypothetical protein